MDSSGSITQFFYNIIPGSIFLFILTLIIEYPLNLLFKENTIFSFFIFLSFGLFIGFIFQGITKFDRKFSFRPIINNLNDSIWNNIKEKNNSNYKLAKNILDDRDIKYQSKEDIFYMMHNYLMANGKGKRTDFYMDRVAFWANIYYGNLILIIVSLIFQKWIFFIALALFSGFFCRWLYHEYLRCLYDVVLKTFVIIDSKNQGK